jgi:hypothetical protein
LRSQSRDQRPFHNNWRRKSNLSQRPWYRIQIAEISRDFEILGSQNKVLVNAPAVRQTDPKAIHRI